MIEGQQNYRNKLKEILSLRSESNNNNTNQQQQQPQQNVPEQGIPENTEPVDDNMYETDPDSTGSFPIPQEGHNVMDPALMQQPAYDDNGIQILNDIASDESLPVLGYYISQLSHLGEKAQARLIARASAFQSKNQVFSNIVDTRDYQMAQDDYAYAKLLSTADFTAFDMNTDYFTAEAIMESQHNIRLRRSRKALNLQMINTRREESYMGGGQAQQEEHKNVWSKIPFIGGGR
jgi:hypothetical protein